MTRHIRTREERDEDDDDEQPTPSASSSTIVTVPAFPSTAPHPKAFTYFTERYFSQYIIRNCKGIEGNNVRLLLHSNGLCIVCVDPSSMLMQMKIVSMTHSLKHDRSEPIKVQGKRKKNALLCQLDMALCFIDVIPKDATADAVVVPKKPPSATEAGQLRVPACVDGLLLEINPFLVHRPELLQEAPLTEGFIAVVNPNGKMKFDKYEKLWTATSGEVFAQEDE